MTTHVVDASVILKTILSESSSVSEKFEKVLLEVKSGKSEIISIKLLKTEVGNGIRYGEKEMELGLKYYDIFLKLPIKYIALSKSQYKTCLKLSYGLETTFYDTSYHVLAKAHNAIFLTSDKDYYSKAKDLGNIELIS